MDSFLENNNRFLAEANELLRHYDEQVIREREKFIRELENKNKVESRTAKPTAHSSFQKENMERRDKIVNKQSTKLRNRRKNVHLNSDTDDSEPREFEGDSNENRTRRATTQNGPARRSRANQDNQITEDNSEFSDNNNHPRPTMHFPFGMTQTPFQIMSNWPLKLRNNKEDSPAHFLDDLKRFKKGYQISDRKTWTRC